MKTVKSGYGIVVVGGQWGDEGKGRIVDILAQDCDITVRFHGGNNAGHSLHFENKSIVLHVIPCGIVRSRNVSVIANGVVIDPEVLLKEIDHLKSIGIECSPDNLKISVHAHVILPWHKMLDQKREAETNAFLGTTKRGIGPCYEDKIARIGLRIQDLVQPQHLNFKLKRLFEHHGVSHSDSLKQCYEQLLFYGEKLRAFMCDSGEYIEKALKQGARVLFEGAQGALLDVDHGSYPFVTSSNCVAGQASVGSGIGPKWLQEVLMVSKVYCTRVGEGPFLSELDQKNQEIFRQVGNEFGATTGRPRRCGWLDLPALRYASQINGATGIILTKLDVLSALGQVKVVSGYQGAGGEDLSFREAMDRVISGIEVKTIFKDFGTIEKMPHSVESFSALPFAARDLCEYIENFVGVPVVMLSYGKERGQEINLKENCNEKDIRRLTTAG
ncbi:MAG: adenylosuccinate synthase [Myxococcales bacterium]|nr:adenylosuccinate synthase [Myxococcales bacterium]USN50683.1 MAG: adenylosuccinate synthase [Myxococcales bacterium]